MNWTGCRAAEVEESLTTCLVWFKAHLCFCTKGGVFKLKDYTVGCMAHDVTTDQGYALMDIPYVDCNDCDWLLVFSSACF